MIHEEQLEVRAVMHVMGIIGGKWKFPILYQLYQGPRRFREIEDNLTGVSPAALSNALKELQHAGLIAREVLATGPVSVEYRLTAYGKDLQLLLLAIQHWGKKHRKKWRPDQTKVDVL